LFPDANYLVVELPVVEVDSVEVVLVDSVDIDDGVSEVSVEVVIVPVVSAVPVSSTTFGCSVAVEVSPMGSSAFLQPPRKRTNVAVAAIRKRARDFFIP
jgi:hypothetical protein